VNYAAHYDRLIERAILRGKPPGYSERHHIVPRCVGGGNEPGNIVRLTPEEHFVAHQLLLKIFPGHKELIWSAIQMTGGNQKQRRSNKLYGWLRRRFREHVREKAIGRKHTPETLAKMSAARKGKKGKPHSPETKAKMSAASKGKKKSEAHIAALSRARTGRKYGRRNYRGQLLLPL
jgi:hypothetical protein